jgi:hypothetical protein
MFPNLPQRGEAYRKPAGNAKKNRANSEMEKGTERILIQTPVSDAGDGVPPITGRGWPYGRVGVLADRAVMFHDWGMMPLVVLRRRTQQPENFHYRFDPGGGFLYR